MPGLEGLCLRAGINGYTATATAELFLSRVYWGWGTSSPRINLWLTMQHPRKDGSKLGPGLYLPGEVGQIPKGSSPSGSFLIQPCLLQRLCLQFTSGHKSQKESWKFCAMQNMSGNPWCARWDGVLGRKVSGCGTDGHLALRAAGSLTSAGHLIPESRRGLMPVLVRSQLLRGISSS